MSYREETPPAGSPERFVAPAVNVIADLGVVIEHKAKAETHLLPITDDAVAKSTASMFQFRDGDPQVAYAIAGSVSIGKDKPATTLAPKLLRTKGVAIYIDTDEPGSMRVMHAPGDASLDDKETIVAVFNELKRAA